MNRFDYIAENQRLREEIEHLKAFQSVSVRADLLDLALQCAEMKAKLEEVSAERKEKCFMCDCFERNPQWLVSNGNGVYEEYIYKYCTLCGRKLNGEDKDDRP